jgi:hypothetical protein
VRGAGRAPRRPFDGGDTLADPSIRLGPDPLISQSDDSYIQPSVAISDSGFALVTYEREDAAKQAIGWARSGNWTSGSPTWTRGDSASAGWPKLTLSDGSTSNLYSSDTTVVATSSKEEFVVSTIIGDVSNAFACKDIAIALTENGGASFTAQKVISTETDGRCAVDQPTIAYSTSSKELWAWWRDSSSAIPRRLAVRPVSRPSLATLNNTCGSSTSRVAPS